MTRGRDEEDTEQDNRSVSWALPSVSSRHAVARGHRTWTSRAAVCLAGRAR